jgi:hypothetical protein
MQMDFETNTARSSLLRPKLIWLFALFQKRHNFLDANKFKKVCLLQKTSQGGTR